MFLLFIAHETGTRSMTKKKTFMILQTIVCILLTLMLSLSAVRLYREGTARKAQNPLESIYTPENVADALAPAVPLFLIFAGLQIAGLVLGVKNEDSEQPARGSRIRCEQTALKRPALLQAVIVVVAVILIIAGISNGGARDVLVKAVTICSECIGLG